MTIVAIILAAAAVALGLARWQRIPAIPLLIVTGVALNVTGALPAERTIRDVLLLGLTFLVFVVGAELDPSRVRGQVRAAIGVGMAQFLVLGAVGAGAMLLVGYEWLPALYVGLAVTASSTLLVVTLLRQREQFFEPLGHLLVGVLLVQDMLVILLLPALTYATEGAAAIGTGVVGTIGLVILAGIFGRWLMPLLLLRLKLEQENLLLAVLATLFLFVGVAHWLGLPLVTGAFLAGVSMSRFPIRGLVGGQVTSLSDFFLAVFFVALGASATLPGARQLAVEGVLLVGVLLMAPPLVIAMARYAGLTTRASIEAGHLLAQCGEFGLVVAILGVQHGHLGENVLAVIVLIAIITMSLTPFLTDDRVTWALMHRLARLRRFPAEKHQNHVLIIGCGTHVLSIVQRLVQSGQAVVVIDDDDVAVRGAEQAGAVALRGDGADYRRLRLGRAREARAIISTMRRIEDNARLLRFVNGDHVFIRVFSPADGARVKESGGVPLVEAEAALEHFLAWFDYAAASQPNGGRTATDTGA